jgi:hypothetical protein
MPLYSTCISMIQWQIIVLAYLRSQCTKFHAAGLMCWIFMPFYLVMCIWAYAISWWIQQGACIKFCANLGKSATQTVALIRQVFRENSMSHTRVSEWNARFREGQKTWDRWRAKSGASSSFSLTSKGSFIWNLSWQAKQSIPHITVMFYRKCAKISLRTLATKELDNASWQRTVSHFLFLHGIFYQNNIVIPTQPTSFASPHWR